jgi:LPS sulfotransferase NodH
MTQFVVLSQMRSGSTWLVSLLDSHPEIQCLGELLRPPGSKRVPLIVNKLDRKFADDEYRHHNYREYLQAAFALSPDKKAHGFKLMLGHNATVLNEVIADPKWRIIFLRRDNELATYASHKIANATGQSLVRGSGKVVSFKPKFDKEEFNAFAQRRINKRRKVTEMLCSAERGYIDVEYKQLYEPETHRRILEYLDVDPNVGLVANTVKRGCSDILHRFSNADEIDVKMEWTEE